MSTSGTLPVRLSGPSASPCRLTASLRRIGTAAAMCALQALPSPAHAQTDTTGTVRGVVLAGSTTLPVVSAGIQVAGSGRGAMANESGSFTIAALPPGAYTLRVRALGYRPAEQRVTVPRGGSVEVTIRLEAAPITLNPVRTRATATERERFELSPDIGVVSISGAALGQVPAIGEADVLRTVQLLPGVVTRNDFTAGYNVRGGESDQNLVLLDGIPVYNPFHLGGLFGTFMEPTVRDITLLTGGFPAVYGGRLSSVLEVTSVEEARQGLHGSANVSMLASSLALGSALPNAQGTWNVAARRTYADAVVGAFTDRVLPYHFRDAQAHGSYLLPRGATLSVTGYDGEDVLDGSFGQTVTEDAIGGGDFSFTWGNRLAGLTLVVPLGSGGIPLGFVRFALGDSAWIIQRASHTRFRTTLDLGSGSLIARNQVDEQRLQGTLTSHRGSHSWNAGYELSRHHVRYRVTAPQASVTYVSLSQTPTAAAVFVEDTWRTGDRLIVRPGVRAEWVSGASWTGISPRVSAKYFLTDDMALTAGGGQYAQWMHSLRNEDFPLRVFDFWIASDEFVAVTTSWHAVGGFESWFSDTRFARLEGYFKKYDRLHEANPEDDFTIRGDEFREIGGHAYGVDLLLRQLEAGRFGGWIAYTYGVSARERNGRGFWPAQDRRHSANVVATYRPDNRYTFAARFGYGSGTPYTDIVGQVWRRWYNPERNDWDTGITDRHLEPVGGDRNAERYPSFQRLDLSVQRRIERRNATIIPYLQVVNAYNRRNVFTYIWDYMDNPPTRSAISQFPLLPTVGVTVDF